jgi:uncharacterized protein (TIGR00730 family)
MRTRSQRQRDVPPPASCSASSGTLRETHLTHRTFYKPEQMARGVNYDRMMRRVCVFCGSSVGNQAAYAEAAIAMGALIARRGLGLVYGGGNVGLMGIVATAALEHGGEVIGVIPQALADREIAHTGLSDLRIVDSMHTRKAMMADLSDAFIAMPGGVGTFEEFFEVVTWTQLGLHRKPCGLLNVNAFYTPLAAFIDKAVSEGFIKPIHRTAIVVDDDPERLLDTLGTIELPAVPKWIEREET